MIKKAFIVCCSGFVTAALAGPRIQAVFDKPDARYASGDPATLTANVFSGTNVFVGTRLRYTVKDTCWQVVRTGDWIVAESGPLVLKLPASEGPADFHVHLDAFAADSTNHIASLDAGCVVDLDGFRIGDAEPGDFDAFWAAKRKEVDALPLEPVLAPLHPVRKFYRRYDQSGLKNVWIEPGEQQPFRCYDVSIPCPGPRPARGVLTIPVGAAKGSLPIRFVTQGMGGFGTDTGGVEGFIQFELNKNGLPPCEPEDYYREVYRAELDGFMYNGADDRETYYMKWVVMRLMRALDFVKTIPEWDGTNLVVVGTSFGGAQALMAAGIDKDVSLCVANDPAMCGLNASCWKTPRQDGWPGLHGFFRDKANQERLCKALSYYDVAFFARRVNGPVYLAVGLSDSCCTCSGAFAAWNAIPEAFRAALITDPYAGHCRTRNKAGFSAVAAIASRAWSSDLSSPPSP